MLLQQLIKNLTKNQMQKHTTNKLLKKGIIFKIKSNLKVQNNYFIKLNFKTKNIFFLLKTLPKCCLTLYKTISEGNKKGAFSKKTT